MYEQSIGSAKEQEGSLFEAVREPATNLHSISVDVVAHWRELVGKIRVAEVVPTLQHLVRQMKPLFYQKSELEAMERRAKELEEQLALEREAEKGKKGKKGKSTENVAANGGESKEAIKDG